MRIAVRFPTDTEGSALFLMAAYSRFRPTAGWRKRASVTVVVMGSTGPRDLQVIACHS
jgi:hypothetical protein